MSMLTKGFRQFLVKTSIFLILFIIFSLIIGQKIVSSALLYKFNIYIYGGMGYILLFSIFGFILLFRKELIEIEENKLEKRQIIFFILSLLFLGLFYILEININKISINILNTLGIHLIFLGIFGFLLLGIYGINFIKNFVFRFKRPLIYFLIFGIIVYFSMNYVLKLWEMLSWIVMKVVSGILSIFTDNFSAKNSVITINGFAAKIGESCSGVYSIFIFSALYIFIIFMDWTKINKRKALLLFLPAIIGAFLVNIIRVLLLFVIGGYYSRELALGLYHSYTGMIFFLIYFSIFWMFAYKVIRK